MENAKNAVMIVGFLFAMILLILGFKELKNLLAGAEEKMNPTAVNATGITGNSATINFTTEKETVSLVSYGTSPETLSLFSAESQQTSNHAVTLSFLSPNTTYYYNIKIKETVYDNNGSPYSFSTKPGSDEPQLNTGTQFDNLNPEVFKQQFGTSNPQYDLNKDGVVNSTDYLLYLKKTQE